MHGHFATFLVVAGRSATVNGQAATLGGQAAGVLIVAGRSATIGTVAEKDGVVINILSAAASGVTVCPSESRIGFLSLVSLLFMLLTGLFFQLLLFLSKNQVLPLELAPYSYDGRVHLSS
ncbi:hypothetical protein D5086_016237 [Populus alba]|uniref:Uncharacterized protein n=1 Tax=Populus alba TaxID=43335 RepID=A0ACC4BU25_POPAL